MLTTLIILTVISLIIISIGLALGEKYGNIPILIGLLLLLFIIAFGWILIGNKVSNKTNITYITLKSVKDSTTFNSIVIYKDKVIKDDSYLLFIQDSMTVKEILSYNMYGTLISSSYIPIIK